MCTKFVSGDVMKRLDRNLEIELDNERPRCRQDNETMKNYWKNLKNHAKTSSIQIIDHPKQESLVDSSKFGLDPPIISLQEDNPRQTS